MRYRSEVDGLRAVAVVPVILFHADFPLWSGGFVGVDIFFVISGYLITTILLADMAAGRYWLLDFYERRARRILPALLLVLGVCVPFAWLWMLPGPLENFGQSAVATLLFSNNILLTLTAGYWDLESEFKPLLHTWSLGVEEQFYILFPLLPTLGAAFVLLGTLVHGVLSLRPVVFVGLVSYSAYLWHQPLFAFARVYARDAVPPWVFGLLSVLTLLLAWLTWRYVERPFRVRAGGAPRVSVCALAVSMGGVSALLLTSGRAVPECAAADIAWLEGARVFFFGPKNFGANLNWLMRVPAENRTEARNRILPETLHEEAQWRDLVPPDAYVSLLDPIRIGDRVTVADGNGYPLSGDRVHLTRNGAVHLGARVLPGSDFVTALGTPVRAVGTGQ